MKQIIVAVLLVALAFAPAAAQSNPVKIRFAFEGEARATTTNASEVGNVLAMRGALRAWTDSVDILLDQAFISAGERGWLRARENERADYLVSVIGVPVLTEQRQPTGMTIFSLVLFESKYADWKYTSNRVGYAIGAENAASSILSGAQEAINQKRRMSSR